MRINEDLLPIHVGTSNPKNKQIYFKHSKNLLDIQYLAMIPSQNGTVIYNSICYNVIINTENINMLYIKGNFALLSDGLLRIGLYNSYPSIGSTGTHLSKTTNGPIAVSNSSYVLFGFITATETTTEWLNNIKSSFMISTEDVLYESYVEPTICVNNDKLYLDSIDIHCNGYSLNYYLAMKQVPSIEGGYTSIDDGQTRTFPLVQGGVYLFINSHIYKRGAVFITYYNQKTFYKDIIFKSEDQSIPTFSMDIAGQLIITLTLQTRGYLYQLPRQLTA